MTAFVAVIVLGALFGLCFIAGQLIRTTDYDAHNKPPAQASPPAPGTAPVPGQPTPNGAAAPIPVRPVPAPADHGGLRKRIDVYYDGRTQIRDYHEWTMDVIPGSCPACTAEVDEDLERLAP